MKMLKRESIPIVETRKIHLVVPAAVFTLALLFILVNFILGNGMFNYDVAFVGGTSIRLDFREDVNQDHIAAIVMDVTGEIARIQTVNQASELQIRMRSIDSYTRIELIASFMDAYPLVDEAGIEILDVSATVSGEMQRTAVIAVLSALGIMFIYIAARFRDVNIGLSTIINLLVNTLVLIGFYAIARVPLNESFIIVILTVLGYSINNTIIIFDRLRENRRLMPKADITELINKSVAQSLTRTTYATVSTAFVVVCLLIFGVATIREFAAPILFGILFGTYSSLSFAACVMYGLVTRKTKTA